jgi:hypothetical protein
MAQQEAESRIGEYVRLNSSYGSIPKGTLCRIAATSEVTVTVICEPWHAAVHIGPEHQVTEQEWQQDRSQ